MAASASFFLISHPCHSFNMMTSNKLVGRPDMNGIDTRFLSSWHLKVKANANIPSKMMLNQKTRSRNLDPFSFGKMVEDDRIFRQTFTIRSYESGRDEKASIETILNCFQETIYNFGKTIGLTSADGIHSTPEMCKNLIWVVTSMQVEADRYPIWGDIVQVDVCLAPSGKNGLRCDWLLCDCKTNKILIRGLSNMALMNKLTRKLSKTSFEVQSRLAEYFRDTPPIVIKDTRKVQKLDETTADYVCSGLMPRWSDLDASHHVNNVKYIGWILESTPQPIMKNYELASMTFDYLQECRKDCVLQALTSLLGTDKVSNHIDCEHVLRHENGSVILKGWTRWCLKYRNTQD